MLPAISKRKRKFGVVRKKGKRLYNEWRLTAPAAIQAITINKEVSRSGNRNITTGAGRKK